MIRAKAWIKHDGEIYDIGDLMELDQESEDRLVKLGVAEREEVEICEDPASSLVSVDREDLEEEYRRLGGRPQDDWPLGKLLEKLEERRKG